MVRLDRGESCHHRYTDFGPSIQKTTTFYSVMEKYIAVAVLPEVLTILPPPGSGSVGGRDGNLCEE